MAEVYLLRHAKARAAAAGARDFDRPLDKAGIADIDGVARAFAARFPAPATILCSTALRARQTLAEMGKHIPIEAARFLDKLYGADGSGYLAILRDAALPAPVMLVGHNPMMEHLAVSLCDDGDPAALNRLRAGFPTSGLAVVRLDKPLSEAGTGDGRLEALLTPGGR